MAADGDIIALELICINMAGRNINGIVDGVRVLCSERCLSSAEDTVQI